jgi:hypothetical protein
VLKTTTKAILANLAQMGADFVIITLLFILLVYTSTLIAGKISTNFEIEAKDNLYSFYTYNPTEFSIDAPKKEKVTDAPGKVINVDEQEREDKKEKKDTVASKPDEVYVASMTVQYGGVEKSIEKYANQFGVSADVMKRIAYCESGFRPGATNGPYAGIYQFLTSTWISNRRAMGLDTNPALRYDAEEAAKTAAFKMAKDGFGAWPVCSRKALNKI